MSEEPSRFVLDGNSTYEIIKRATWALVFSLFSITGVLVSVIYFNLSANNERNVKTLELLRTEQLARDMRQDEQLDRLRSAVESISKLSIKVDVLIELTKEHISRLAAIDGKEK